MEQRINLLFLDVNFFDKSSEEIEKISFLEQINNSIFFYQDILVKSLENKRKTKVVCLKQ